MINHPSRFLGATVVNYITVILGLVETIEEKLDEQRFRVY